MRKQLITDAMLVLALKAYLPLGPKAVVTDAWLLDTPEAKGMRAALEVAFATRLESDAGDARDAERYRKARTMRLRPDNDSIVPIRPDKFDALIDAEIANG